MNTGTGDRSQLVETSRTLRILLVEDDDSTRSAMRRFLEFRGHEVLATGSVCEALNGSAAFKPEVLISDWKLDGARDGVEMAATLAAEHELAIIMVTAHRMEMLQRRAMEIGIRPHACRRKPVSISELASLAESLVAGFSPH